ncbi:MAG TPA: isochorismate synthase [Sporichthyaceae bacterium]|nr:isochorismate synthase [Sporichthyaceae bacterium]
MTTAAAVEPLIVKTVELTGADAAAVAELTELLPAAAPLAWIRHGDGIVGWGEAARVEVTGPDRFLRAMRWWRALCSTAEVRDTVGLPACGPVVFGSFAFADGPTPSTLVLPRVLVGRRDGRTWLTTVDGAGRHRLRRQVALAPARVEISAGALSAQAWREAVGAAIDRIRGGELSKVVLARDLFARADGPVDVRHVARALARGYPQCFTFTVDGLVGATPELLIRRFGTAICSRVLAGTAWRSAADAAEPDAELAARLWASTKEREEHAYAAHSAADALRPHCSDLTVPATPTVLALPNVVHLATEVTGTLRSGASALDLAGLLHPTAAVCGTPQAAAARVITELEGMDRGRYAGPVGWMDAAGDGEWGIALRCAQVEGDRLRLFAGCGIVAGSDPEVELAETEAKFLAVRDTLDAVDVDQACLG